MSAVEQQLADAAADAGSAPAVEIVVPVFDEVEQLEASVRRLHSYLASGFPFSFRITIADNGSTDGTWAVAARLAHELPAVTARRIATRGRGRALHAVWSASDAQVLSYMDVDLSTDLAALLPLVAPLLSGHSDLAIGTRRARGARVVRGPQRELISRAYNRLLHIALATRFSDAQCGFKAIRADRARQLLPLVRDGGWFFDTELLVLAERAGFRIHEVPVDWTDDPDSRVDIVATAIADLKGVARLARDLAARRIALPAGAAAVAPPFRRQVGRFVAVGIASTAAYLVLYLALRTAVPAQAANAIALVVTAIANTAANRRFTFDVRVRGGAIVHQVQGLAVFGLGLALTAGALAALHAADPHPGRTAEVAILVAANLAATVLRFVLFRGWVFRGRRQAPAAQEGPA